MSTKMLTSKQTSFCQAYVEIGNASEAYRRSYNSDTMKSQTIWKKASELLDKDHVRGRIQELQAEHRKAHDITVEKITTMYLADRALAHELANPSAAVAATTGLARLFALEETRC